MRCRAGSGYESRFGRRDPFALALERQAAHDGGIGTGAQRFDERWKHFLAVAAGDEIDGRVMEPLRIA